MGVWLGRYRKLLPLRARDSFHLLRADTDDGPALVVMASPRADRAAASAALARFADAHARIDHPSVPRTRRAGVVEGVELVELACDAVADGEELLRIAADSGTRFPYAVADAFTTAVREALQGGHRVGLCLGRIAYANILFSADGRLHLVGFGHNVVAQKEAGGIVGTITVFSAPELDSGGELSPTGDYVALLHMSRTLAARVDMADALTRVLSGRPSGVDAELVELMRWYDTAFLGSLPHQRRTIDEGIAVSARIREILGAPLDHAQREAFMAELLAREGQIPGEPDTGRRGGLVIGPEALWFLAPDGIRRQLGSRRALRRILLALVDKRLSAPGAPLAVWDVVAAGWPGEDPIHEAALNRVYVTMTRLRGLGLGEAIERFDDGYRLSPRLPVAHG